MQTVGGSLPLLLGPRATRYPSKRPFASRCLGAWAQTGLTGDGARSRSQCPVLPTGLTGGARPRRQHPTSPTRAHLPPQLHLQPPARRVLPRAPPCVQLPRGGCSGTGVSVVVSLQPRCPGGVQGSPPDLSAPTFLVGGVVPGRAPLAPVAACRVPPAAHLEEVRGPEEQPAALRRAGLANDAGDLGAARTESAPASKPHPAVGYGPGSCVLVWG